MVRFRPRAVRTNSIRKGKIITIKDKIIKVLTCVIEDLEDGEYGIGNDIDVARLEQDIENDLFLVETV